MSRDPQGMTGTYSMEMFREKKTVFKRKINGKISKWMRGKNNNTSTVHLTVVENEIM